MKKYKGIINKKLSMGVISERGGRDLRDSPVAHHKLGGEFIGVHVS